MRIKISKQELANLYSKYIGEYITRDAWAAKIMQEKTVLEHLQDDNLFCNLDRVNGELVAKYFWVDSVNGKPKIIHGTTEENPNRATAIKRSNRPELVVT